MSAKSGTDAAIREHLGRLLTWEDSHVGFEKAIAGIPESSRGKVPEGAPYSPWQLLEHMRRAQHDILEFCRNSDYQELRWPEDYWPKTPAPPSAKAWDESVNAFQKDREELVELANDPGVDLTAPIPHGQGQTCLREIILAADHAAYHLGELVLVRRLLGIWKSSK